MSETSNDIANSRLTVKDAITWAGILIAILVSWFKGQERLALLEKESANQKEEIQEIKKTINESNDKLIQRLDKLIEHEK